MTESVVPGQSVVVPFAGRLVQGTVADVRWRASFNDVAEEIVVDAGPTQIAASPAQVSPAYSR